jgi:hypothetical protein
MTAYGSWEIDVNADGGSNPGGYICAASVQPAFFNFFDGTQAKTVRNLALGGITPTLIGSPTYTPGVSGTSPGYASFNSASSGLNTNVTETIDTPTTGGALTVLVALRAEGAIPTSGFSNNVLIFGDNDAVGGYAVQANFGNSGGNIGVQFAPSFETTLKSMTLTNAQMQAWGLYMFQYSVGGGVSAVNMQALTAGISATPYAGTDAVPSKTPAPITFGQSIQSAFVGMTGIGDFFCGGIWTSYLSAADIAAVAAQIRNRATQYGITL